MKPFPSGGLSEKEAKQRLLRYGKNELKEQKKITPLVILLRQFTNFILLVLLVGAVISFLIAEMVSFWVILGIIIFVTVLGFFQEYKAEKSMEALKALVHPIASVIRGGNIQSIPAEQVVPGDILLLEAGDKISADSIIKESTDVQVDEAILTGESLPVAKKEKNIIFAGTQLLTGKCRAEVIATGMQTKLGKIAGLVQKHEEKTPLQLQIKSLTRTLAIVALTASIFAFLVGILRGAAIEEMLFIALALVVAAVPEGLPLTLTLTLAYGMRTLAQEKALVRKMLGVETLGSTTVICTDKTGTLTKNEMTVEKIFVNNKVIQVSGSGYEPKGQFLWNGQAMKKNKIYQELAILLNAGALCTNASLYKEGGKWKTLGDPTEAALVGAAAKAGIWKEVLEEKYPRREEILFTSERKLMSTIHQHHRKFIVFSKGAVENILKRCTFIATETGKKKLDAEERDKILHVHKQFAAEALRVLAIAGKSSPALPKNAEEGLTFFGLVGMNDPPREGVKKAITLCKQAGITVVMITGDHKETAIAVAKKVGIFQNNNLEHIKNKRLREIIADQAITGEELDNLNEKEFAAIVESVFIYARIQPEQKLRIVEALKRKGNIVAMTGDGVNDAPALKRAHIGVAMGIKGTDVAREASTIILQDDHFATIVDAIKIGRGIRENIEKFTLYLVSRNFTEVTLILLSLGLLGPALLPLLALQILFINTFDEVMPAIALGLDAPREELMLRKPLPPKQKILCRKNLIRVVSSAVLMASIAFTVFLAHHPAEQLEKARTMTFTAIVGMVLFVPFAFRSLKESILRTGFFSNKLLLLGVASTFLLTLLVMYIPVLQQAFELVPLGVKDWGIALGAAATALIGIEIVKWGVNKHFEKEE